MRERVYCAGPLFNTNEQDAMEELALALEAENLETFLPQRDGLELTVCTQAMASEGYTPEEARELMSKAIFALDVYQVLEECDAIVVNLNGRVPDEGAISEAAMAWHSGKAIVGYKADGRSVFFGQDNPLVAGLFCFSIEKTIANAVRSLKKEFAQNGKQKKQPERHAKLEYYLGLGEKIWEALQGQDSVNKVVQVIKENK